MLEFGLEVAGQPRVDDVLTGEADGGAVVEQVVFGITINIVDGAVGNLDVAIQVELSAVLVVDSRCLGSSGGAQGTSNSSR